MAADFELNLSLPADERFGETLRALAVQVAQQAGCDAAAAGEFGRDVVAAWQQRLPAAAGGHVPIVFRHAGNQIDMLLTVAPPIRVARTVPLDV